MGILKSKLSSAFFCVILLFAILNVQSCKKDPCESMVCLNGGICIDGSCDCPTGYSGPRCENSNPCANVSCLNGGTCNNGQCICPTGYSGPQCQNFNPCANINCLNGGTCANGQCNCPTGYGGSNCSIELIPTSVRINSITLTRYPMTNSSGGGWDAIAGNGPDVFLTVNSGTTANLNSFVSSVYDNVTGQTLTYSSGLPITLASPNSNYTVAVWDEDTASNDFMGGVYFIPNNFKAGFPSSFNLTTASLTIVLNVTWLF